MNRFAVGLCLALVSCTGAPVREGTLPDGRVLRYDTEWDPNIYSKPSGKR